MNNPCMHLVLDQQLTKIIFCSEFWIHTCNWIGLEGGRLFPNGIWGYWQFLPQSFGTERKKCHSLLDPKNFPKIFREGTNDNPPIFGLRGLGEIFFVSEGGRTGWKTEGLLGGGTIQGLSRTQLDVWFCSVLYLF